MSVAQKDILNGWKEIAGYVARDIRTVERWEKQRGLPVRRVPGTGRATVYARISELEEWLASGNAEAEVPETQPLALADETRFNDIPAAAQEASDAGKTQSTQTPAGNGGLQATLPPALAATRAPWQNWATAALALAGIAGMCALFLQHKHRASAASRPPDPEPAVMARSSVSSVPGVEDLYLRGTYFYEQRTPETLNQALSSFHEAIARDPRYAPAYAGLSSTYNLLREYSVMPDDEAYPKARDAAERAVALDPKLAQAYVSLGFVEYYWDMQPARAEQDFKTAIALDPNLAHAHHWYGSVLTHEGRYAEALHELDLAQHLQPSSSAILTSRALAMGVSGHALEARAMLRDLLNHDGAGDDRNSSTAHLVLGLVSMIEPHDFATDLTELRRVAEIRNNKDLLDYVNIASPAFQKGGEPAMWRAVLAHEEKLHTGPANRTLRMAESEANLGQVDRAFADLNQLASRRDKGLTGLSMDPMLQPLHRDPRFAQLRAKLDLPPVT